MRNSLHLTGIIEKEKSLYYVLLNCTCYIPGPISSFLISQVAVRHGLQPVLCPKEI